MINKNSPNALTSLINIYLFVWEEEEKKKEKEETFKQSLMQAFPSKASEIWSRDENALGEEYEQISPATLEEFVSIEEFLSKIDNMNAEDLEKT